MSKVSMKGLVKMERFAAGSKSEHVAVCIESEKGCFKIKLAGGNPFHDPELEQLVGKRIEAKGTVTEYLFVMESYTII